MHADSQLRKHGVLCLQHARLKHVRHFIQIGETVSDRAEILMKRLQFLDAKMRRVKVLQRLDCWRNENGRGVEHLVFGKKLLQFRKQILHLRHNAVLIVCLQLGMNRQLQNHLPLDIVLGHHVLIFLLHFISHSLGSRVQITLQRQLIDNRSGEKVIHSLRSLSVVAILHLSQANKHIREQYYRKRAARNIPLLDHDGSCSEDPGRVAA